jgi:hypothetical protein
MKNKSIKNRRNSMHHAMSAPSKCGASISDKLQIFDFAINADSLINIKRQRLIVNNLPFFLV